jgi:hypothetical protein
MSPNIIPKRKGKVTILKTVGFTSNDTNGVDVETAERYKKNVRKHMKVVR